LFTAVLKLSPWVPRGGDLVISKVTLLNKSDKTEGIKF